MNMKKITLAVLLGLLAILLQSAQAPGQTPFYQNKTIQVVIGSALAVCMIAGVVFLPSTWASTYPAILISLLRTCPGGGSMIATNYLYGLAKPDGLTIGMFQTFMYLQQLVASQR